MSLKDFFLDIFFPKECVSCGQKNTWLCQNCFSQIVLTKSPSCPFCKTLTSQGQFCSRCRRKTSLTGIMVTAYYEEGPLKEAIRAYKYKFIKELVEPLSDLFINHLQQFPLFTNVVLAPVPLHKSRLRQRGFNQAALLAQKVADVFGAEYEEDALIRVRKTKPQVELSGKARKENVKDAFRCLKSNQVKGKNILLIDDVCTTGATLEACAYQLRREKVKQVWGLVLARQ
jgi:ComF family protein